MSEETIKDITSVTSKRIQDDQSNINDRRHMIDDTCSTRTYIYYRRRRQELTFGTKVQVVTFEQKINFLSRLILSSSCDV